MERGPVPIGDVMGSLLKRLGLEGRVRHERILREWDRIVGDKVARHSRPVSLRGKILTVHVDSSVWLAELSRSFKGVMLDGIRGAVGEGEVRDIRFRIGDL